MWRGLKGLRKSRSLETLQVPHLKDRPQEADLLTPFKIITSKLDLPLAYFWIRHLDRDCTDIYLKFLSTLPPPSYSGIIDVTTVSPPGLHLCGTPSQPISLLQTMLRYLGERLRTIGPPCFLLLPETATFAFSLTNMDDYWHRFWTADVLIDKCNSGSSEGKSSEMI